MNAAKNDLALLVDADLWKLVAKAAKILNECPPEEKELNEKALAEVMDVLYVRKAERDE